MARERRCCSEMSMQSLLQHLVHQVSFIHLWETSDIEVILLFHLDALSSIYFLR